jgi:hypothetical protein
VYRAVLSNTAPRVSCVSALLEPAVQTAGRAYVEFAVAAVDGDSHLNGILFGVTPLDTPPDSDVWQSQGAHMFHAGSCQYTSMAGMSYSLIVAGFGGADGEGGWGWTPRGDAVGDRIGLLVEAGKLYVYINGRQAAQPRWYAARAGGGNSIALLPPVVRFAADIPGHRGGNSVRIVKDAPIPRQDVYRLAESRPIPEPEREFGRRGGGGLTPSGVAGSDFIFGGGGGGRGFGVGGGGVGGGGGGMEFDFGSASSVQATFKTGASLSFGGGGPAGRLGSGTMQFGASAATQGVPRAATPAATASGGRANRPAAAAAAAGEAAAARAARAAAARGAAVGAQGGATARPAAATIAQAPPLAQAPPPSLSASPKSVQDELAAMGFPPLASAAALAAADNTVQGAVDWLLDPANAADVEQLVALEVAEGTAASGGRGVETSSAAEGAAARSLEEEEEEGDRGESEAAAEAVASAEANATAAAEAAERAWVKHWAGALQDVWLVQVYSPALSYRLRITAGIVAC